MPVIIMNTTNYAFKLYGCWFESYRVRIEDKINSLNTIKAFCLYQRIMCSAVFILIKMLFFCICVEPCNKAL